MNDASERAAPDRPRPGMRHSYRHFQTVTTRWADNDAYRHVNNTVYHQWFDTTVNRFLIQRGLLDVDASATIALMAENGCRYHSEIAYPDDVTIGIRVARIGGSSVRYESAAFRGKADAASAEGFFVHVYVARATMRPVPVPDAVRAVLLEIAA